MTVGRPNGAMLRQLRTLYNIGTIGGLTDGQLLEHFATERAKWPSWPSRHWWSGTRRWSGAPAWRSFATSMRRKTRFRPRSSSWFTTRDHFGCVTRSVRGFTRSPVGRHLA